MPGFSKYVSFKFTTCSCSFSANKTTNVLNEENENCKTKTLQKDKQTVKMQIMSHV